MDRGATFSPCGRYRYRLWRIWDDSRPYCMFLMLNPSTADAEKNDPTVARCQKWAEKWGYGGLHVCNIFAYRATDPEVMKAADDPIGRDNEFHILEVGERAGLIVCGWGNHGSWLLRGERILEFLRGRGLRPHALRMTKQLEPSHPLYLPGDSEPFPI